MDSSIEALLNRMNETLRGIGEASFELVAAIIADGHVLIEGAPGVGKTTLANVLAKSISGSFRRVQFTPDLLPSDLVGYSMYRQDRQCFEFIEGPVFANLILADEINRTSPRIQSALLECMNERQVSVDGTTRDLPALFHVIATQNNRFSTGTFPLPEPQLDRFLVSIEMSLPTPGEQVEMLERHLQLPESKSLDALCTIDKVAEWKEQVRNLPVSREICEYIVRLCEGLRGRGDVDVSLSNRAALALTRMSQSVACLRDHPAVYPEDVQRAFIPVMAHRMPVSIGMVEDRERFAHRRRAIAIIEEIRDEIPVD